MNRRPLLFHQSWQPPRSSHLRITRAHCREHQHPYHFPLFFFAASPVDDNCFMVVASLSPLVTAAASSRRCRSASALAASACSFASFSWSSLGIWRSEYTVWVMSVWSNLWNLEFYQTYLEGLGKALVKGFDGMCFALPTFRRLQRYLIACGKRSPFINQSVRWLITPPQGHGLLVAFKPAGLRIQLCTHTNPAWCGGICT